MALLDGIIELSRYFSCSKGLGSVTAFNVDGYLSCVIMGFLASLLHPFFTGGFPVGWFRFTSRPVSVPNLPSHHDYLKHKILLNSLRGGDNDDEAPFVFLSLSNTFNELLHTGIGGFDRTLFRFNPSPDGGPGDVESLELDIPNLGDTDATKRSENTK